MQTATLVPPLLTTLVAILTALSVQPLAFAAPLLPGSVMEQSGGHTSSLRASIAVGSDSSEPNAASICTVTLGCSPHLQSGAAGFLDLNGDRASNFDVVVYRLTGSVDDKMTIDVQYFDTSGDSLAGLAEGTNDWSLIRRTVTVRSLAASAEFIRSVLQDPTTDVDLGVDGQYARSAVYRRDVYGRPVPFFEASAVGGFGGRDLAREPSTLAFLGIGLAALVLILRRKR